MSAKKRSSNPPTLKPLVYRDSRLERTYSVMEMATLAANCAGESNREKLEAAVSLLSVVEEAAISGPKELLRRARTDKSGNWNAEAVDSEFNYLEFMKWATVEAEQIWTKAARDPENGKIRRTSLAGLAYQAAGIGEENSPEAGRLYSRWIEDRLLPSPSPWPSQNEKRNELLADKKYLASARKEALKLFEAGKTRLIHDDDTARLVALEFLVWLTGSRREDFKITSMSNHSPTLSAGRKRGHPGSKKEDGGTNPSAKSFRSRRSGTKGQFVSIQTKGALRAVVGITGKTEEGKARRAGQFGK